MYYTNFNRVYIIAILKRKDYNKMLKLLAEDKNALYVLTSGNATDGYATSDELYECMKKYVPIYNICKKSLADAIEDAMSSEPNIANFIIGSFYMYGTVVNKIEEVKNKKLEKLRVF
jgi:folylpolyglutamate synthase/dihydropteroate synthase